MILYLAHGWYGEGQPSTLRTEVIDGAIDSAGKLYREGVAQSAVSELALIVRSMAHLADPTMAGNANLDDAAKERIWQKLAPAVEFHPNLEGFALGCFEHVQSARDLRGMFLHLIHIGQMLQLLQAAGLSQTTPPTT